MGDRQCHTRSTIMELAKRSPVVSDAYDGSPIFAVPAIKTPSGVNVSQGPLIMSLLGKELGLCPEDPIKAAKAMQACLDGADMLSEASKFEENPERAVKWLTHIVAMSALRADDPVDFADFMCMQIADVMIPTFTDEQKAGFPALMTWVAKVEATKGYKAFKALGLPLLPGS